jgi:hypothetical protein
MIQQLKRAIDTWGEERQYRMVEEEAQELALATHKYLREPQVASRQLQLLEEVADMEIMIEQLCLMQGPAARGIIEEYKERKIHRLRERLDAKSFAALPNEHNYFKPPVDDEIDWEEELTAEDMGLEDSQDLEPGPTEEGEDQLMGIIAATFPWGTCQTCKKRPAMKDTTPPVCRECEPL